jgi:hypothetical protein
VPRHRRKRSADVEAVAGCGDGPSGERATIQAYGCDGRAATRGRSAAASLLVTARRAVPRGLRPDHGRGTPRTVGIVPALPGEQTRGGVGIRRCGHRSTLARPVDGGVYAIRTPRSRSRRRGAVGSTHDGARDWGSARPATSLQVGGDTVCEFGDRGAAVADARHPPRVVAHGDFGPTRSVRARPGPGPARRRVVAGRVDGQAGRPRGRGRTIILELLGLARAIAHRRSINTD